MMFHRRILSIVLLLALALSALASTARAGAGAAIDPELASALAAAAAGEELQAIAGYDPALTSGEALSAAVQALGAGTIAFTHLDSLGVLGTASQIAQVADMPGVTGLYANSQLEYYLDGSIAAIGADRAWHELNVTGEGVGIAIIDTGIDARHPDLRFGEKTVQNVKVAANAEDLKQLYEYRGRPPARPLFSEDQLNSDTTSGHGTHVAGIAAGAGTASEGRYTGVARDAQLVGIGTGEAVFVLWALAAFDYVLDHQDDYNIKVVNNSWGETARAESWDPQRPINEATRKLYEAGINVVFAAGNDGADPITGEPLQDSMNRYAMAPWVIAVAAGCTSDDPYKDAFCPSGELALFSGKGVPGDAQFHPTLTAPGVNIIAARAASGAAMHSSGALLDAFICPPDPIVYYTCNSGTSMAAPHVAGAIALMLEANPALTPDAVKQTLVSTARPMLKNNGLHYQEWEAGAGYLDAYAAVRAAQAAR